MARPATQRQLDFPAVRQFHLAETWSMDGLDFKINRMLDESEVHLAGLQGPQVGPYPVRKLPKKRRRSAKLALGKVEPELKPTCGRMNPEYEDQDELDLLLLEAARLASLEQLPTEIGTLDDVDSRAETPTISNRPHLDAYHIVHSHSSTSPAEYNAHGCITARSKGKGRAN
ncbi:hypothetical protein FRC06_003297 [Ceratobasidium sp. 370]|nr:hypothetical protein FRC06_003297 [Ceratobasidium sp. 370]